LRFVEAESTGQGVRRFTQAIPLLAGQPIAARDVLDNSRRTPCFPVSEVQVGAGA
jgi:hypothetical protein